MKITINGQTYHLPSSLAAITLQQRIEFDKLFGKALREQLKKVLDIKDDRLKELEFTDYHCKLACQSLSYFAAIPLEVVYKTAIDDVLAIYHQTMKGYADDYDFAANAAKDFELKNEFAWQDTIWVLAAPELTHESKMTFGELIIAKQTVQNLVELGDEKWEALLPLCCIFFRKKDEVFREEFLYESNERYLLMKTLPFEFALHVGFFLSSSQDFWLKASPYFRRAGDQGPEEM